MQALVTKTAETTAPGEVLSGKTNLIGMPFDRLEAFIVSLGLPKFRAKQIWHWIYMRGLRDFAGMDNIAKPVREQLAANACIERPEVTEDQLSADGTRKWLFKFSDGREVETVFIPETDRGTLCISSQVGCTLACTFCHTGTQRLVRNLNAAEIVSQYLAARELLGEENRDERKITNIVFMGMGEPLFNYEAVKQAALILTDQNGIDLSKRKVTVSTSGVVPEMYRLTDETGVSLAVSLHAVRDELRNEIVPINRKYPLKELREAMLYFAQKNPSRRILIEYVMLQEVNDTTEDAHQLIELLKDVPVKVNLIPFNPWPGSPYECSSNNRIHRFAKILQDANLSTPIRKTRGDDILAACGQLKSASERGKREKVTLS
jgi:23S rRNA (adenine2503-C2)-methyltransferase